jgi:tripeptidyl-peptidase-1
MSNVFSVSYGLMEGALPRFYQERQCREWMKLALQGVSVIFASGDSGVANRITLTQGNVCLNPELGFPDPHGARFAPEFPANCPYVSASDRYPFPTRATLESATNT